MYDIHTIRQIFRLSTLNRHHWLMNSLRAETGVSAEDDVGCLSRSWCLFEATLGILATCRGKMGWESGFAEAHKKPRRDKEVGIITGNWFLSLAGLQREVPIVEESSSSSPSSSLDGECSITGTRAVCCQKLPDQQPRGLLTCQRLDSLHTSAARSCRRACARRRQR